MLTEIEIKNLVMKSFLLFETQYNIKISIEEKNEIVEIYHKLNVDKQWSKQKIVASIMKCPIVLYAVNKYIQNDTITIPKLSKSLDISSSKIKRYFTDDILPYILGDEKYEEFIKMKKKKMMDGNLKGGINYSQHYQAIQKSNGTFNGCFNIPTDDFSIKNKIDKKIVNAAKEIVNNLSSIQGLSKKYGISENDILISFIEVLPHIDLNLYYKIISKLGLESKVEELERHI